MQSLMQDPNMLGSSWSTLLSTDYKILSEVLATRLREVMENVIHCDQTYCVPGRSMMDNIHLIQDVL